MADEGRRSFLGLSWFQVIAGALAAMTSAWIASELGVAGTLIGAALGSLVATVTSAFYTRSLERSRTLIVRTDGGTVVETAAEPGETAAALEEIREATGDSVRGAEVVDTPRPIHWKTIGVTTVVVLVLSLGAMGAYELITGQSYGSDRDNPRIGNPFGGSSSTERPDDDPVSPATSPTPTPVPTPPSSPTPTDPNPTETPPTTPTPSATTPSPTFGTPPVE